ncbi:putative ferric-chelate reductase 1 [Echeneis naucrates]|uniref:putative ferric-chelate reductase 1 n=1 Tax=Echeneis naucrates TaxID=173247 RepID=UPI001113CBF8|nr:putative ferric-chelate reductase 1 [Echeneis naucrates]
MDRMVLLLLCAAPVVRCFSSGLVTGSCVDMLPNHSGLSPQTDPAPFSVTTDHSNYTHGEEVKVHLQALGSKSFTGFLLQAREEGGQSPVGSFSLTTEAAQLLLCSQRPNSAVSHRSESVKMSIQAIWRADAKGDGKPIQFHASFVQSYKIFWVNVKSLALTFNNDSTGGSTSLPPDSTNSSNTTLPPPTTMAPNTKPPRNISSTECGVTKVCFSQPAHCDPAVSAGCYFMSALMLSSGAVHFEMTGPSDGYVSFGLSDDQLMGNDDIYICGIGSNGLVALQHAYSTGRTTPQAVPLGNVSEVRVSAQDGVISCSFTSMNSISTHRTSGFDKTYYLMLVHGPSRNGQIQHHRATFISAEKINIFKPQTLSKARWPHIMKAHGALMLIAWMTTGSLGMIVARYLKGVAKGQSLWGKDVWFLVHVAVMSVTTAATIIAFILSFSHVKGWSGGAHPVLGCLVMILSFFQPIMALLRCGPQHPLRFLFNWSHALNGFVIKTLAVAAIFTGLKLFDRTLDQWLMKVMGGFVGWEVLFYVLLDGHFKWKTNNEDTLDSKMISVDVLLMALFLLGNISFLVALLVGIGTS